MKLATLRRAVASVALLAAHLAWAHAYPKHQEPPAGSTVQAKLNAVVIDFDDALEPAFSSITVTDAQGKAVTNGKSEVEPSNSKRISVGVSSLTPGVYTVAWVAVAADGHRTQGHYRFTVK
ncbi:copper resistance CopC family protein [Paraburkholderia bannensis]|uniref:copper resistance CopC family protein n=1 Tax=Paraburkholderia bannensis TaxID=765414 RepID=UPI000488515A|nr:copper resistance CopC family protein [Paraburkholderia bannensis]